MPGYRARPNVILHLAIDAGIGTRTASIARASRLSERTVRRALAGELIGAGTMGALCLALNCYPADCFIEADRDAEAEAAPSLRPVSSRRSRPAAAGE